MTQELDPRPDRAGHWSDDKTYEEAPVPVRSDAIVEALAARLLAEADARDSNPDVHDEGLTRDIRDAAAVLSALPCVQPVDDASFQAKISEIGNQIHNLGCEHQNDEALSSRLGDLASELWRLALVSPTAVPQPVKDLLAFETFIDTPSVRRKFRDAVSALAVEPEGWREALKPFDAFAKLSGFDRMPDDMPITKGSSMAARQLTAGDLRRLLASAPSPPPNIAPSTHGREGDALADIAAERHRQIEAEGWTTEHDDKHTNGEMARAAGVYAVIAGGDATDYRNATCGYGFNDVLRGLMAHYWPWERAWFKPTNRRRDLVKAGALIAAEIERLDRLAPHSPVGPSTKAEER